MSALDEKIHYGLLGPVTAWYDGSEIDLGGRKHRTALAVLLLRAGRLVPHHDLIDALWGDDPPTTAANLVHKYLSGLRRALPAGHGLVVLPGSGYLLRVPPGNLDLHRFDEHQREVARLDGTAALDAQATALAVWRGPALTGADGHYVNAHRTRLTERFLAAHERHADLALALGRHAELIPELSGLTTEHPLREGLRARLMTALHRAGRTADALGVYHDLRHALTEQLGLDPGQDIRDLHDRILTGRDEPAPAPVTPATPVPAQLPADVPDFTGRDDALDDLTAALASGVAVGIVTGPGGIGKTTLAVHAAHRLREAHPDGQLFIDLRGTTARPTPPGDALRHLLTDLGVSASAVPEETERRAAHLRTLLTERRVLLVLDNAADAAQVRDLLPGTGPSRAVITSRTLLTELPAAHHLHLDTLTDDEARTLLTRIAHPHQLGEPAATSAVLDACAGLPLALRIAGARLARRTGWTARTLADRLTDTAARLDELAVGDLAVRTTFEASHDHLPADGTAARAFRLLGTLDGTDIGVPAAAAALGMAARDVEDAAELLVDKQLLHSRAPGRYGFHDLLRLFARERSEAADQPDARRTALFRLVAFGTAAAGEAQRHLRPGLAVIGPEPSTAVSAPELNGATDARAWWRAEAGNLVMTARQAIDTPTVPAALTARLCHALYSRLLRLGRLDDIEDLAGGLLRVAAGQRDGHTEAVAHLHLGAVARFRFGFARSEKHYLTRWNCSPRRATTPVACWFCTRPAPCTPAPATTPRPPSTSTGRSTSPGASTRPARSSPCTMTWPWR